MQVCVLASDVQPSCIHEQKRRARDGLKAMLGVAPASAAGQEQSLPPPPVQLYKQYRQQYNNTDSSTVHTTDGRRIPVPPSVLYITPTSQSVHSSLQHQCAQCSHSHSRARSRLLDFLPPGGGDGLRCSRSPLPAGLARPAPAVRLRFFSALAGGFTVPGGTAAGCTAGSMWGNSSGSAATTTGASSWSGSSDCPGTARRPSLPNRVSTRQWLSTLLTALARTGCDTVGVWKQEIME